MSPLRLQHRIVWPFAAIALLAVGATTYTARVVTARVLESRIQKQLVATADVLSQSDLALNAAIIRNAGAVTGADVVTFSADGTVLASTLDTSPAQLIARAMRTGSAMTSPLPPVTSKLPCGRPCEGVYRRVTTRPDTFVAVVVSTDDLAQATAVVTRTTMAAAAAGVLLMFFAAQVIARRVTRPIDRLVAFTDGVADGNTTSRAAVDASEVGALARAFNEMLDRLSASRTALVRSEKLGLAGLFAARVAHDIRNPLASIKLQAQVLHARLKASGDTQTVSSLLAIQRDVLQVESVVRDLLELARPGELRARPVSLNGVVDDVLQQLSPHLEYRQVTVHRALAAELPPVLLDVDRFKQALLNVINNASDAMPDGGMLQIETSASGNRIRLDVCDDGTGVDPAVLPRVFDPFVSTKSNGMGLGLVNAKAVVESHNGHIELAPRQPAGTRVTITLPTGPTHG